MWTVIKPKFASIPNCPIPKYLLWQLTCAKKCNPQVMQQQAIKEKEGILALDKYQAGDII